MTIPTDYSNQRYGKLVTIKEVDPYIPPSNSYKKRRYLCKCDCGNETIVHITSLRSGNTKSCGCVILKGSLNKTRKMHYTMVTHNINTSRVGEV